MDSSDEDVSMPGKRMKRAARKSKSPVRKPKSVDFEDSPPAAPSKPVKNGKNGGMKASPSQNTLDRHEREQIVLFGRPFVTVYYAVMELFWTAYEFLHSLLQHKATLFLLSVVSSGLFYAYITPGNHQQYVATSEKALLWWGWWIVLGVASSIGLGSGLHTFLIYLGPHIAKVTLAAYECNSLNFPEPPYPDSVICPIDIDVTAGTAITLWQIVSKVRVESLLWGAGTALGELPPYFMARAARLGGEQPDDEEYQEFLEMMNADKKGNKGEMSLMERGKLLAEKFISSVGFPGILLFASIPNPLFDLAGITCGHFLVPFWSFFGATLIGKAIVKMHVQMLFVIIAFSEHHVENFVNLLGRLPVIGQAVRQPIRELLQKQKMALHREPGAHVDQESTWLQIALSGVVGVMIIGFLLSIINSMAQRYHKRVCSRKNTVQ